LSGPGFLFTVLSFLLVIGPLVFIHELGHYFVGRWFGVGAEAFSIGFGREVIGWTDRRGTRWKLGWLPLGGYVKFKGDMNPASQASPEWLNLPPEERNRTFQSKPAWQRFLIVLAGPATNFLFAIIVYMAVFANYGEPSTQPVVAGVTQGSAAQRAGLQAGDLIKSVNGNEIGSFEQLAGYVAVRPETRMRLLVEREGRSIALETVSSGVTETDSFGNKAKLGRLGVYGSVQRTFRDLSLVELPAAAVRATFGTVHTMTVTLGQLFTGKRSVKEMGGPLKIAQYSGQQASLGWFNFLMFMTLISINLGFINLLPIPMLDGGHLLFYAVEGVRRKPVGVKAQELAFRTGLAVLLAMMIFVTFNDLASFGLFARLAG
jgi:regulator of sigma E protease